MAKKKKTPEEPKVQLPPDFLAEDLIIPDLRSFYDYWSKQSLFENWVKGVIEWNADEQELDKGDYDIPDDIHFCPDEVYTELANLDWNMTQHFMSEDWNEEERNNSMYDDWYPKAWALIKPYLTQTKSE